MKTIGATLRSLRENKGLLIREVAAKVSIDTALLSKIERDERRPTKNQIKLLANFYKKDRNEILITYLSDRVFLDLKGETFAIDAIQVAEKKIKYLRKKKHE